MSALILKGGKERTKQGWIEFTLDILSEAIIVSPSRTEKFFVSSPMVRHSPTLGAKTSLVIDVIAEQVAVKSAIASVDPFTTICIAHTLDELPVEHSRYDQGCDGLTSFRGLI